ncbi:RHS repeat-associated core domain-containing protein [Streptacidiphilus sp. MAP12-16]|uniref:RHS repeat-associated core domain-containing protein n=1 Tax=Streptacidiphilus sp. MAP12-16 TaxID=3156300 RepID=UPI0035112668
MRWSTAALTVAAVLVPMVDGGPAVAAAAKPRQGYGAAPAQTRSIPVTPVAGHASPKASGHLPSAPRHTTLPASGAFDVTVAVPASTAPGTPANAAAAPGTVPVQVGRLPVTLSALPAGPAVPQSRGLAPTAAAAPASVKAHVQVADQATSSRLGVRGVVLSVSRTDTGTAAQSAKVALDYRAFADAYGAGWGSRLKLYAMPACALTTPQVAACRTQTPLVTTNTAKSNQVSAVVPLAAASPTNTGSVRSAAVAGSASTSGTMVLAAQATGSGDGGSFTGASQLTPDGQWSGGSGAGGFSWSYPISIPTVPGGLQPTAGLGYNSQAVDGRTSATSPQAGWAGDGWSDSQNYVERDFTPCSQDSNSTNNTPKTGDMCWSDAADTLTLSLNGSSTTLVHDASGGWRPQSDNGEQIQVKTDTVNGDNSNQYWVVTTGGTSYYFGLNRLPGWTTGAATTNSVDTVPVYGNDPTEPCHAATFAASSCNQAYKWHLDYVVDSHQDAVSYWYQQATNYYGADNGTTPVSYIRDSWLDHVSYGQRAGHVYDSAQPPAAQLHFDVSERCDTSGGFDCSTAVLNSSSAPHWPDVPYDQNCPSTGTCNNHGASFWTTKELTGIRTTALVGTTQTPVDSWALSYSFPPTGDATPPSLWLTQIQRTGQVGGTAQLKPVIFTPRMIANRVSSLTGYQPITRGRLYKVTTETGSVIQVNYANYQAAYGTNPAIPACDNRVGTSVVLPGEDTNTWLCYPAYWTPPGLTVPILDWFNKYVVTTVTQTDPTGGGATTETDYNYAGGGAWHFDDSPGTQAQYRTWDQWRGFAQVDTRTGAPGTGSTLKSALFFRGMDGDKTKTGTRSVTLNDHAADDPQADHNEYAGQTFETLSYNGDGGALLGDTVTDPWLGPVTATQDRTAAGLGPLTARQVNTTRVRTTTTKADGKPRTTETDTTFDAGSGLPTQVDDKGDTSTSSDDKCVRTTYAKDASGNLLPDPVRITTLSVSCGATPVYPQNLVSDEQVFYDGSTTAGTAPTAGDVTRVDKASVVAADGTPTWTTVDRSSFDQYGREISSTNGDNRVTTTAYLPATGASPTEVDVTLPLVSGQTAGFKSSTFYDPTRGETTKTVDASGLVTTSTYDPLGRLTGVWAPGFSQTANPNQPNTRYSYNLTNAAPSTVTTQVLNNDGTYRSQISLYDAMLRPVETQTGTVDGGRNITDTFYDSHGWVQKTDNAYYNSGAPSTTLVQAPDNQVPSSSGTVYDGIGRPTDQIAYHLATQTWDTQTTYAGSDRTDVTPPQGATKTSTITDARGHTTQLLQYQPGSTTPDTVTYGYDPSGNQISQTDQATATIPAHTWTSSYDLLGRKISSTDPDTGTTTTVYDNAGLVTSTTDARGRKISYNYDEMGRKTAAFDTTTTSIKSSANKLQSYVYDSLAKGQPTSSSSYYNGNAYTTAVSGYDTHGWTQGTYTTVPTSEGALAGTYSTSYTYSYTGQVTSYTDSAAGNLASETIGYGYDQYGQQTSASSASWDYLDKVAYNELGQPLRLTYGPSTNFAQQTLGWDDQTARLTNSTVVTGSGSTTVDNTSYAYANSQVSAGSGLITSITDQQNPGGTGAATDTQCYGYDYLQRLTSAWTGTDACAATPAVGNSPSVGGPNPYWRSWTYDQQGNRLTQVNHDIAGVTANDVTTTNTPVGGTGNTATGTNPGSPAHGLVKASGSNAAGAIAGSTINYTYDASGNTTSRTSQAGTDTLTYDTEGKLFSLATTGSTTETTNYRYDASGNLLIRQDNQATTLFVGDEEITLNQGATQASAVRYIAVAGMTVAVHDATGQVFYTIPNQQGTNQLEISASNTASVNRRSYTPFGQDRTSPTFSWMGDKGFVGGQRDDTTGLTNLGAREYDPSTGKFLSPDPLIASGDPQQWNAYAYANNSPVSKTDPEGLVTRITDGDGNPQWIVTGARNSAQDNQSWGGRDLGQGDGSGKTTVAQATADQQAAQAEAAAQARAAATASAVAAAAKANKEGLLHKIISLVGDLIGVTDAVNCFTKGDVMGCISTALNFVPWGKIFKAMKVGVEAFKVWHAIEHAEEAIKGAEDIEHAAVAAEDGARAEAEAANAEVAAAKQDAAAGCPAGAHSFIAGTQVAMADGSTKKIQDIHAGDLVLATDPQTGLSRPETVVQLITTTTDHDFTQLTLATTGHGAHAPPAKDSNSKTNQATHPKTAVITTTWHHPFWNATTHQWTNASQLTAGTQLRQPDATTPNVTVVRNYHATATTYDLTVTELHTYYVLAGTTPVLVHNDSGNSVSVDDLTSAQQSNYKRYIKKLPAAALDTEITSAGDGAVQFETRVPGRVPGSYALYAKIVNAAGDTTAYNKTTVVPDGSVAHVKDKFNPSHPPC